MKGLEQQLKEVHRHLGEALPHSPGTAESALQLSMGGKGFPGFVTWMDATFGLIENRDSFKLQVDEVLIDDEELNRHRQRPDYLPKKWTFTLNKKAFLASIGSSGKHLFFLTVSGFSRWLQNLNPFQWEGPGVVVISVEGIQDAYGGPGFQVVPPEMLGKAGIEWPDAKLPDNTKVRRSVRVITGDAHIHPDTFLVSRLSGNEEIDVVLLRNSFLSLSATLVQEFYSSNRVTIKGYRNANVPLLGESEKPSLDDIKLLQETVAWVYEERTDTRMKLLADRLSLELTPEASWYSVLAKHLEEAFQQAKEMYRFVILDRQDAYYRELRSLLGELQNQSKAYSSKIKGMTESLFRDVLASLFLVAFGLFSKTEITKIGELLDNQYLLLLLKGLAIYLIISYLFQLFNNRNDLRISRKELEYWMKTTRNYLPPEDVEKEIENAVIPRRRNYNWTVAIIGVAYLVIGVFCWFVGNIF